MTLCTCSASTTAGCRSGGATSGATSPSASTSSAGSLLELFASALEGGSKSAARRTAEQGGAYVNNRQERDLDRSVREEDLVAGRYLVLRKGRKRYHLVRFG